MSPPPKYNRPEAPQWLSQSIRLECSSQPLLTHPGVCTGLVPKDTAPAPPFQAPDFICSQGKHGTAVTNPCLLLGKRIWGLCNTYSWQHGEETQNHQISRAGRDPQGTNKSSSNNPSLCIPENVFQTFLELWQPWCFVALKLLWWFKQLKNAFALGSTKMGEQNGSGAAVCTDELNLWAEIEVSSLQWKSCHKSNFFHPSCEKIPQDLQQVKGMVVPASLPACL